jgi:hypothetical protein
MAIYFYLENGYAVGLTKIQIKNPNLQLTTIVFVNKKAMFS